ncbi:MAG: AAA family ATPase [Desulfococcaceae bacterium]
MPTERFQSVCKAMADPGFYPHPVSNLQRLDTHISTVFLTGDWVYKLKRPVDVGFLDYRKPEDRRYYCEREVDLNRRLSRGVYEGMVTIYETSKGFSLSKEGQAAEYAVKMKQLPDRARLDTLLHQNRITPDQLSALGRMLADFYADSEGGSEIDRYGRRDVVIYNSEENFMQLDPFVDRLFDGAPWKFIQEVNRAFLDHHQALFERRLQEGKIRDGHGDLRTEHIYYLDRIQIIDCIEFNDRFRYGDAAVDMAFLHMDMEYLGYPDAAQTVLKAYAKRGDDPEVYALIDFYAAYRAIVRLKIACIRYREAESEPERKSVQEKIDTHLNLAYRHTLMFSRPTLWVICGLPASGKSSLAEGLARSLSIGVIRSDDIRKEDDARNEVVPFGQGRYSRERRARVYGRMLNRAQDHLKQGRSVILDATYALKEWRAEAVQLAADLDTYLLFAECGCDTAVLRSRLKAREESSGRSDARLQHLTELMNQFEPLTELHPDHHIRIATDAPIRDTLIGLLSNGYLCKTAQLNQRV